LRLANTNAAAKGIIGATGWLFNGDFFRG